VNFVSEINFVSCHVKTGCPSVRPDLGWRLGCYRPLTTTRDTGANYGNCALQLMDNASSSVRLYCVKGRKSQAASRLKTFCLYHYAVSTGCFVAEYDSVRWQDGASAGMWEEAVVHRFTVLSPFLPRRAEVNNLADPIWRIPGEVWT
jgi:hypothetical protein